MLLHVADKFPMYVLLVFLASKKAFSFLSEATDWNIGMVAMEPEMPPLNSSLKNRFVLKGFRRISIISSHFSCFKRKKKDTKLVFSLCRHIQKSNKHPLTSGGEELDKWQTLSKFFLCLSQCLFWSFSLPISGKKKSSFIGLTEPLSTKTEQSRFVHAIWSLLNGYQGFSSTPGTLTSFVRKLYIKHSPQKK